MIDTFTILLFIIVSCTVILLGQSKGVYETLCTTCGLPLSPLSCWSSTIAQSPGLNNKSFHETWWYILNRLVSHQRRGSFLRVLLAFCRSLALWGIVYHPENYKHNFIVCNHYSHGYFRLALHPQTSKEGANKCSFLDVFCFLNSGKPTGTLQGYL